MSSDEPPFHSVAIVGFGLIGGSIALAIRERWPSIRITAVDRAPVLAHAAGSGAIDRAVQSVANLGGHDLVILAAPVEQNLRLLPEAAAIIGDGGVITDVGGTKREIVTAACALSGARDAFVGGHPIGGAEQGGFAFARADLFRGRPWILTPNGTSPAPVVERLAGFVESLGARPTTMNAEEHDRLMAFLSHMPQLAVSALMEVVGEATASIGLRLAGRGLVDSTRLASSPADVWREVCASNAGDIGVALDQLIARLQQLRAGLTDAATVDRVFERAAHWRSELMKGGE
ncbi:MAG TPA: prephenate dehydrogenase/arogenate dehydrogenase family protein [Vicinamibacterales bacterium]|nr:prephenate dehydrogenase/arogenate dehydrogenase family protein [Vicinamibacterales bacterium]